MEESMQYGIHSKCQPVFLCKGGMKGHISQLSLFNFLGLFPVLACNIDYLKCANLQVLRATYACMYV